jgi:adenylate kinase
MAKYLVLFGPPGVGKGTQAERLKEALHLAHVATGDLFRDNLKRETELGKLAKSYMDRGALVPDEVTIGMVRERLKEADTQNGVLFDGFPRTVAQAEALDKLLSERGGKIEKVIFINASPDVLLDRLGNRWTCKQCGAVYNTSTKPPKVAGVCDNCGGEVYQRPDDKPEVQKKRIDVYLEQTSPLIEYFDKLGMLVRIDGQQPIETVYAAAVAAIGK